MACAAFGLFGFDVGQENGNRFFHDPGTFYYLWQKHLAGAEKIANHVHSGHQRAFNHIQCLRVLLSGFFCIFFNKIHNAFYKRMLQPFLHGGVAPGIVFLFLFTAVFHLVGISNQAVGGIFAAVHDHVFHQLKQVFGDFIINLQHGGIDDAHVHAGLDGAVKKCRVHGFPYNIVSTEGERKVTHTTTHFGIRQVFLNPLCGIDVVNSVIVVFFNAGGNGKDIGVENYILSGKMNFFGQDFISAFTNPDFAI